MTVHKSSRSSNVPNAEDKLRMASTDATIITQTALKKRKADSDHPTSPVSKIARGLALVKQTAGASSANKEASQNQLPVVVDHRAKDLAHLKNCEDEVEDGTLFSPPFHSLRRDSDNLSVELDENQPLTVSTSSCHTSVAGDTASEACTALVLRETSTSALSTVPAVRQTSGDNDEEDVDEYPFDPFLFIKNLPPLEECLTGVRRTILPKQTRRSKQKTLVLDLDETLVHSSLDNFDDPDFTFPVEVNRQRHMVNVKKRPHLRSFLEAVANIFEVVVFTASQRVYAEQLLNIIDPNKELIRYRLYRDACVLVDGNYLKDLTVLGRDLQHTVIVDNSPQAFGFQLENGIPIESWYDNENDSELLHLLEFLKHLVKVEDVRPIIARTFKLHEFVAQA